MNEFPSSLFDFTSMFSTERACLEYLFKLQFPDGFVCPYTGCRGKKYYWTSRNRILVCAKCDRKFSLTYGTVMVKSKTSLRKWFLGAYFITTHTPGISALQFQRQAGIPRYETAFQILHKLRAGTIRPNRDKLKGYVEVDETWIGGKKSGERGRGARGKTLVVAAVEVHRKSVGRVRLRKIPNASHETLVKFLQDHVERGTTVKTDGWSGYLGIERYGYRHEQVIEGIPEQASVFFPHIHRVFSNLKSWIIGIHHGVSKKHIQAYLNEYTFRFNRRFTPMQAFNSLLKIESVSQAPTYKDLYSGKWIHPNPRLLVKTG